MAAHIIKVSSKGKYQNLTRYLNKLYNYDMMDVLNKYGEKGVAALRDATPADTGLTKDSWVFQIKKPKHRWARIVWSNTNVVNGWYGVALYIQYGHATRNGGYVQGIDYINPAMRPLFEQFAEDASKEISKL